MTTVTRIATVATALLVGVAAPLGVASPAYARFDDTPVRTVWEPDGPVHAVATHAGTVYLGGLFTSLRNPATGDVVSAQHLAALDATTGAPVPGWSASADADVHALAVSGDGTRVLVGGEFGSVGGETHRRLAALSAVDGSVVSTWRPTATGTVRDLLVVGDRVYVGGSFGAVNGVQGKGLAALWLSSGERDPAFHASTDQPVYGLARVGQTLVFGGSFTAVNGAPRRSLAAVNLLTGNLGPWAPNRLCATCLKVWDVGTDGTRVYVGSSGPGGWAGAYVPGTRAPRWVAQTNGDVQAVALADGLLYLGGHFRTFRSQPRTQLAAVNPTTGALDPEFAPEMKASYPGVWEVTASSNHLHVAGNFLGVGRRGNSPYYAAFRTSTSP